MAWNVFGLILLSWAVAFTYVGYRLERVANKDYAKVLQKEIQNNYREIENLREIIYYYESRSGRHLNASFARDSAEL